MTREGHPVDDELRLHRVLSLLWARKYIIGAISSAAAIISIVISLLLPDVYRSQALLAPNDRDRGGGLATLAAQFGGFASLAGIDLGNQNMDKVMLGLEVIRSRAFISDFIKEHELLVPLFAIEGWDRDTNKLIIDEDVYDPLSGEWVRRAKPPRTAIPSEQEAFERFLELLVVVRDPRSGLVTVGIEHYSPEIAKQWVDWLIEDLNRTIMQNDVAEAERAINFLEEQINETSLSELRTVFYNLIEEQTKTMLLAKVTDEYLLKTLDPAVTPELKSRPKRALIVILCTFMGFVLSIGLALAVPSRRSVDKDQPM